MNVSSLVQLLTTEGWQPHTIWPDWTSVWCDAPGRPAATGVVADALFYRGTRTVFDDGGAWIHRAGRIEIWDRGDADQVLFCTDSNDPTRLVRVCVLGVRSATKNPRDRWLIAHIESHGRTGDRQRAREAAEIAERIAARRAAIAAADVQAADLSIAAGRLNVELRAKPMRGFEGERVIVDAHALAELLAKLAPTR